MTKHNLSLKEYLEETKIRFMKYVRKSDNSDGCWEWIGYKDDDGYGRINIKGLSRKANRISYLIFVGNIPDRLCVCHICDRPGCVNPSHLFLGKHQDNMTDKVKKNRQSHHTKMRGENNGSHKLTEQGIYQIREMIEQGYTQQEIAEIFGVTKSLISEIKLGKSWSWLK